MSRYNIIPREDGNLEIVIGWDNPLNTFFAHVVRPGPPDNYEIEDEYILLTGNRLNEIGSVGELAKIVSPWADVTYGIKKKLVEDQAQPYERSPLQNWMIKQGLVQ